MSEEPTSAGPEPVATAREKFHCPACGAHRPSAHSPLAIFENGRVVGSRVPATPNDDDLTQSFTYPSNFF